jgi:hypothetical protein
VLNHIAACQILAKEFGLTIRPGLAGADPQAVRLTSGEFAEFGREHKAGLTPETPVKVQIGERIEASLIECDGSFDGFSSRAASKPPARQKTKFLSVSIQLMDSA